MNSQFPNSRQIWKPADPSSSRVDRFRRSINRKHGLNLSVFYVSKLKEIILSELFFRGLSRITRIFGLKLWVLEWPLAIPWYSVLSPSLFCEPFSPISSSPFITCLPPSLKILSPGSKPYLPTWFPSARLNYAENLLQRNDDAIAVTSGGELGIVVHTSFRELRTRVAEMAAGLRAAGVGAGDRVAGLFLNLICIQRSFIHDWLVWPSYCYEFPDCSCDCYSYNKRRCNILQYSNRHGCTGKLMLRFFMVSL